jgi:dihydropteroate synthase
MSKSFKIMGILNVTPDSFSDGGDFLNIQDAMNHVEDMINNGADIIDVGGESTRPNSEEITAQEEILRAIPVIEEIHRNFPDITISIDTTKYAVALAALDNGATIVNDISGLGNDPKIAELVARFNAGLIIMHIQGNPKTMQLNPQYNNVVEEVFISLKSKIGLARRIGAENIWADVGIGFGKTLEHNLELLRNLDYFHKLDVPLALGISRKAFIGKILNIDDAKQRDVATALLHSLLINKNIDIIRVHNVKYLNQLRILNEIINNK